MSSSRVPLQSRPDTEIGREVLPGIPSDEAASSIHMTPGGARPLRIAIIGNHLPRQCGIATFTTDLCDAVAAEYGTAGVFVVAVNDSKQGYRYPARVGLVIAHV